MRKTLDSFLDGFIQSTFSSSHYCKEKKEGAPTGKCISLNISKNLPHFRGFGCRILKEKIDSSEECLVSRTRSIYNDCEGISTLFTISIIFINTSTKRQGRNFLELYLYREMCFYHFPWHHDKEARRHSHIIIITIMIIIIIDIMTRRREGTPTGLIRLSASLSHTHFHHLPSYHQRQINLVIVLQLVYIPDKVIEITFWPELCIHFCSFM